MLQWRFGVTIDFLRHANTPGIADQTGNSLHPPVQRAGLKQQKAPTIPFTQGALTAFKESQINERTLKVNLFDLQGNLQLHQVAQSFVQPDFISRDGAATSSLDNLCQCFTTFGVKSFLLLWNICFSSTPEVLTGCPDETHRLIYDAK